MRIGPGRVVMATARSRAVSEPPGPGGGPPQPLGDDGSVVLVEVFRRRSVLRVIGG